MRGRLEAEHGRGRGLEQEPLASWRATVDSAAREPAAMKVRHQRNQSRSGPQVLGGTLP